MLKVLVFQQSHGRTGKGRQDPPKSEGPGLQDEEGVEEHARQTWGPFGGKAWGPEMADSCGDSYLSTPH